MTRPDPVVDFFIIEANEYIDRLDLMLAPAGAAGPDAQALARQARALRGSATMYRQPAIARLAAGVERMGWGMREGTLRWDARVRGALVAAVDDLRLLVRGVRAWGDAEEARAAARSDELDRLAPPRPTPSASGVTDGGTSFLSTTTARLADALDRLIASPDDHDRVSSALDQVRAVRGLAALRDAAPLPEVCDAVERSVDALDAGEGTTKPRQLALLGAAAAVLRRAATELATGRGIPSSAPEVQRFAAAASALADEPAAATVVPISELFFPGEAGVVRAANNPPSTPRARLRLELVSQAEHLRRLVAEARGVTDPIGLGRIRRELRAAIRQLASSAHSFGEERVAALLATQEGGITSLEPRTLERVEEIAQALSTANERLDGLAERLEQMTAVSRATPSSIPSHAPQRPEMAPGSTGGSREPSNPPASQSAKRSPIPPAASPSSHLPAGQARDEPPLRPRSPTPTGKDLYALLERGIETLGALRDRPLTPPVPLSSEEIVPIESLLYRGSAALQRARELRDQVRASGGTPTADDLDELVDLVALAAVE